jgi:uncharacterized protein (DUF1697 family)
MGDLRALFESIGFAGVETYLQSGNVVFESDSGDPSSVAARVKEEIEQSFGFDVPVIVRDRGRFLKVIEQNPLLALDGIDHGKLHVTFLSRAPAAANLAWLDSFDPAPDRLAVLGDCVYLYCPNGYGRTSLSNDFFERRLATAATTRGWKTVNAFGSVLSSR